ncbi:hypothetical protein Scep_005713 [Stephania cephalantha]|uniref:PEBP-like protein n=1 Tax=Stephania cephalantha TaxID=152367 RepID=A0AAP0KWI4_9MAGN
MASEELRLVSYGIDNEGRLPRKYTGEGQGAKKDTSPPLEGTKSLALCRTWTSPEVPSGPIVPWTHWVVVNIPPALKRPPEGLSGEEDDQEELAGIKEGNNDWKVPGWRGPKLPSHAHRFEFNLYALHDFLHLGNKEVTQTPASVADARSAVLRAARELDRRRERPHSVPMQIGERARRRKRGREARGGVEEERESGVQRGGVEAAVLTEARGGVWGGERVRRARGGAERR